MPQARERMTIDGAPPRNRSIVLPVAFTVVAWASAFVAIRTAGRDFSPGPLSVIRLGVAALVLGGAVAVRRELLPGRAELRGVLICGVLWFGIYNLAINAGERRVDAGTASMLVYIAPVLIALLAGWLLGEGFPRALLVGCAVSFVGVALIAAGGAIAWSVYLAVVPTAFAFTTWAYALTRTTAGRMASASYLVPPLAVLFGWVILDETPAPLALAGGAVVLIGVAVAQHRAR